MRAVCYDAFKGRKWTDSKPKPKPKKGQVLVQVRAAAINPVDYKLQSAALFKHGSGMGLDVCGEIVEMGEGVSGFSNGDCVFGNTHGALADFAVCSADEIAKKPDSLSVEEAAALPTAYLSAYQALHDHGFEAGQSLLVIGASGGCGSAGVSLGKAMGGEASQVTGVCSGKNADMVRALGADRVVDYKTEKVIEAIAHKSLDFVFDTATASGGGEDYAGASQTLLKEDTGMYVALNGSVALWARHLSGFAKKRQRLVLTKHLRADLEAVAALLDKSGSKPVLDTVLAFSKENVEAGFEKLKSRRTTGKIVFKMGEGEQPSAPTTSAVAHD